MISITADLSMLGSSPMAEGGDRVSADFVTADSRRLITIHGLTVEEATALAPLLYESVQITVGKKGDEK